MSEVKTKKEKNGTLIEKYAKFQTITVSARRSKCVVKGLFPNTEYKVQVRTLSGKIKQQEDWATTEPVYGSDQFKYITNCVEEEKVKYQFEVYNPEKVNETEINETEVYIKMKDGEKIAVKRIKLSDVDQKLQELKKILTTLNTHDNVIQYKWSERSEKQENGDHYIYLCFEYCLITLKSYIKDIDKRSEIIQQLPLRQDKIEILRQISLGLKFLHTRWGKTAIIHRDIKPSNILLSQTGTWKVGDMSISKEMDRTKSHTLTKRQSGSLNFMARETACKAPGGQEGIKQCPKTDIFSLGIVYGYVLMDGINPFDHPKDYPKERITGRWLPSFQNLNDKCLCHVPLMFKMMNHTRTERSSIDEVLSHPTFWKSKEKINFISDVASDVSLKTSVDAANDVCLFGKAIGDCKQNCKGKCQIYAGTWVTAFSKNKYPKLHDNINTTKGQYKVKYEDRASVFGLVKRIRNISEHFHDDLGLVTEIEGEELKKLSKQEKNNRKNRKINKEIVKALRIELGEKPDRFWKNFEDLFPLLVSKVYESITADVKPSLAKYYTELPKVWKPEYKFSFIRDVAGIVSLKKSVDAANDMCLDSKKEKYCTPSCKGKCKIFAENWVDVFLDENDQGEISSTFNTYEP